MSQYIEDFLAGKQPSQEAVEDDPAKAFLAAAPAPKRGFTDYVRDAAGVALNAAITVPEAAVGLADIATGGRAGKALEDGGLRFKDAKSFVNENVKSDASRAAHKAFAEAEGIGGKFKAAIDNPSLIVEGVGESLGAMGAGGVAARGVMAARGAMAARAAGGAAAGGGAGGAATAGAIGEGLAMAGAQAEGIRQETDDGLLTPTQAGIAAATGVVGGVAGRLVGGLANKLGVGDADTMIAQGVAGMRKQAAEEAAQPAVRRALDSVPGHIIKGAISEGVFEELPQSVSETVLQNIALGKGWTEGLDEAIVMGVLTGGATGGGAAGARGMFTGDAKKQGETLRDANTAASTAAAAGQAEAEQATEQAAVAGQQSARAALAQSFADNLAALQEQEQGDADVPQTAPPDGAAALAQQQAELARAREQDLAQDPNDEIAASVGAQFAPPEPAPIRPSQVMGLDASKGNLSFAAVMAVDNGASTAIEAREAADEAAYANHFASGGPLSSAIGTGQAMPDGSKEAPVEYDGMNLGTIDAADLQQVHDNADDAGVKSAVAMELDRRARGGQMIAMDTQAYSDVQEAKEAPADDSDIPLPPPKESNAQATEAQQASPQRAQAQPRAAAEPEPDLTQADGVPEAFAQPESLDADMDADIAAANTQIQQEKSNASARPDETEAQAGAAANQADPQAGPATEQVAPAGAVGQASDADPAAAGLAAEVAATAPAAPVATQRATAANLNHLFGTDKKRAAAIARVNSPKGAFFMSEPKAKDFLRKNGIEGTHHLVKKNNAWTVQAKAAQGAKEFASETGTLGVPREQMPQVPAEKQGALVKHLKAQGISSQRATLDAATLKPTQAEYIPERVESAKQSDGNRAVIVSSDGYIVDGHHQAIAAAQQGEPVKAIVLDAPIPQALEAVDSSPQAEVGDKPAKAKAPKSASKAYGAENKLVSASRAEELRKRLKSKLNQMNSGIDPEMLAIGAELAAFHLEAGARKFTDFVKTMAADLDVSTEKLRPYLRGWYNGARDMMEDAGLSVADMDGPDAVRAALASMDAPAEAVQNEPQQERPRGQEAGRADPRGTPEVPGGRQDDSQSGAASADSGDVAAPQPQDARAPEAAGDSGADGLRLPAADVAGDGPTGGAGDAADGRQGAGGSRAPDARARVKAKRAVKDPAMVSMANPGPGNFHIDNPLEIVGGGQVARFDKNMAAIEGLMALRDGARSATAEEQRTLAGYTGWGSFGQELFQGTWENPKPKAGWEARDKWLREHLGEAEWKAAQNSIINAHYTDPPTVMAMWDMAKRMGFQGGRVLEPSMGIGNFFGMMPADLKGRSQLAGIELDKLTGDMAKQLYPDANIKLMGYQESKTPDGFYDVVIGNWPFANFEVADRRYMSLSPNLHDYFFLKAADQTKAGGLVIGITTHGTMDKRETRIRAALSRKAEFVTAIRLPSGAFQEYAGTKVVTDIVILRKRDQPLAATPADAWLNTVEVPTKSGTPVRINEFFANNPGNVIGETDYGHGTTSMRPGMIVHRPENMAQRLRDAIDLVPVGIFKADARPDSVSYITNHTADREGAITEQGGQLMVVRGEHLAPAEDVQKYAVKSQKETAAREAQIRGLVGLRNAYAQLMEADRSDAADAEDKRKALRDGLNAFEAEHGPMAESYGLAYFKRAGDPFYPALASLVHGGRRAAVLEQSTTRKKPTAKNLSARDAYVVARNGSVNPSVAQIAELAKKPEPEVKAELLKSGAVFEAPNGDVVPSDIYLSGNVRQKLREAMAAEADGATNMAGNIKALREVIPADVPYFNIESQLGATWVPPSVYSQYIGHMLNRGPDGIEVTFRNGAWKAKLPDGANGAPEASTGFGTPHVRFSNLVNAALANRTMTVKKKDADGSEYVDAEATQEANERVAEIRSQFGDWLWSDPERRVGLEQEYNDTRNAFATPKYDGSFLAFEGMALSLGNGPFNLRQHQVNAIWRALVNRRSLNAHEVGTGKAQPLDAKLLTPTGWKRMGDIQVGDLVVTQSGRPTVVEAVFPQGEKEVFRVTFSDGSMTECCDEHLWLTQTYQERTASVNERRFGRDWPSAKPKVRSLSEIRQTLVSPRLGAKNHSIPIVEPVQLDARAVPLDPYTLGALIGDGSMSHSSVVFHKPDAEIPSKFVLPEGVTLTEVNVQGGRCPAWRLAGKKGREGVMARVLRSLGLMDTGSHERFVPDAYKFNTVEVRLSVLRGLMDTDGWVEREGRSVCFCSTSKTLADDVVFLVQSLGGTASMRTKTPKFTHKGEKKEGRTAYTVCLKMPPSINPFLATAKAARVQPKSRYAPARYIVEVEAVGKKPSQCIRVSDPSHLYVTDDFIVTHNTFTMGGIAVESRRYGLAKKPLLLAHNANSATIAREINQMYPAAKVLYVDNMDAKNKAIRMRQIANDDWDVVVFPHSMIDKLTFKEETLMAMAADDIRALEEEAYAAATDDGVTLRAAMFDNEEELKKLRSPTAKELVKQRNRIIETIKKQAIQSSAADAIPFEDLGIDMVMVDEAHEFKKPPIATRMKMKGLNTATSNRSIALQFMTRYVRANNGGGNVHTFTGTPITNTLTEIFHQMKYIMEDKMVELGVDTWDGWFGSFAKEVQDVELSAAGEYETVTRLAGFINVPELRQLVGQYMDVVFADDMPEMQPRKINGKTMASPDLTEAERAELLNGRTEGAQNRPYKKVINVTSQLSSEQQGWFEQLQGYARAWRNMTKKARKETMLAGGPESPIVTEGMANKVSFDARLMQEAEFHGQEGRTNDAPTSKASRVVENVMEVYQSDARAAQVIFSDTGYSKSADRKVNTESGKATQRVYTISTMQDIVERLVQRGVPRDQIAMVTGSTSKEERKRIADAVNDLSIRVVIGSTDTLGVGVNMQRNLRAMHHMDAPYMPGELEQRNGRGMRQGNQWNTVLEYRYLTDRIDGRRWQILATKQRFIGSFMKGGTAARVIEGDAASDEQSDVLQSFAEAAGDPRVLIREKLRKQIDALQRSERMHGNGVADARRQVRQLNEALEINRGTLKALEKAAPIVKSAVEENAGDAFSMTVSGHRFAARADAEAAIRAELAKSVRMGGDIQPVGTYAGHELSAQWLRIASEPDLILTVAGQQFKSTSLRGLEQGMRNFPTRVERLRDDVDSRQASLERMREVEKAPFARAKDLADVRQRLDDLDADIDANPVPAPVWLRQGAPLDSAAFRAGSEFTVTGHRWNSDGWFVLGQDAKGEVAIPYSEVTDAQGVPVYEPREFVSPAVLSESDKKAASAAYEGANRLDRTTPVDRALLDMASKGATGQDVLKYVAANSKDRALKQMARLLQQAGANPKIELVDKIKGGGFARYFSDGRIQITPSAMYRAERILMHEMVHANTMSALRKGGLAAARMKALYQHVKKHGGAGGMYGMKNVDEFVAEAFTSLEFQRLLKAIPAPRQSRIKTAWDGLMRIIKAALGVPHLSNNALNSVMDLAAPLMQDDMRVRSADTGIYSAAYMGELKEKAFGRIDAAMNYEGKVSAWFKTVGTMRHLAETNAHFKPVFEAAQKTTDDVSMLANDAAEQAPRLLPRVESVGDIVGANRKKAISPEDNKALAAPLFQGTLVWVRDENGKAVPLDEIQERHKSLSLDDKAHMLLKHRNLHPNVLRMWQGMEQDKYEKLVSDKFEREYLKAGVVFTPNELQSLFGLNDRQISLYQEARAAIDRSLDMTARADMMRMLGKNYDGLRESVLAQPDLNSAMQLITQVLQDDARANPDLSERLLALNNEVVTAYERATDLQDAGYAPLSRFGRHTVDVLGADGERIYFGMFETPAEAKRMADTLAAEYKGEGAQVARGTMSQKEFDLFQGVTPETLEQFGHLLGFDGANADEKNDAFQVYLQKAKNNASAMKRLIRRKGIAGYSEEVSRVLASFVYSNARMGARGLNAGKLDRAIADIPKGQGELKDVAIGLRNYIQDPQEEGQAVRGFMFAQYLGGSIASAMVNTTQPFAVTLPWLSQFGGMKVAAQHMTKALKDMATKGLKYEPDLAHALKMAEDDGVVAPQEIHQLMAQSRGAGALRSGDGTRAGNAKAAAANAWESTKVLWSQPFAIAEHFNRRSTFIAAYRLAKSQSMPDADAFARKAVLDTQFLFSKPNKPKWARGAVGGTLFTFKSYSVSYLELMNRMWTQGGTEGKRAVGWAMLSLMLMGGAGGLPFMEDVEDLVDGIGQMMGFNINSKQWRKQAMRDVMGKELADFLEQGVSGLPGAPIDVSGRLGMGNLLPGTGLFKEKEDRSRDLLEVVGPAGDFIKRTFTGAKSIVGGALSGDVGGIARGAMEVMPAAVRNAAKGVDMAATGMYKDGKGYKVIDTTFEEALAKFIGFQPKSVAEVQEAAGVVYEAMGVYRQQSASIKAEWAKAIFEKDSEKAARARQRMEDWNRNNPDQKITVRIPDLHKRAREMAKDRNERLADTAPKALREKVRATIAEG